MKISGAKLKAARELAGKKRSELAAVANLSPVRIWQIETDEVSNVKDWCVTAMAEFLGITSKELA